MLNRFYRIKDSVEIFTQTSNSKANLFLIQFYKINTRESIYIESTQDTIKLLSLLDGKNKLLKLATTYNLEHQSLLKLVDFLIDKGLIIEVEKDYIDNNINDRYIRQIAYFEDIVVNQNGKKIQENLQDKNIVIFGLGSVGSTIAIILARMGIKSFVFIDYKKVNRSHFIKHLYCNEKNIYQFKNDALKEYLLKIDNTINVKTFNEKILPNSDLRKFIPNNASMIINTADEPYIGHISIKIGRYAWSKNVAMYVAGGFDAHSMSTGEFVIPKITPCIDCYHNNFKLALKDYEPTYVINTNNKNIQKNSKNIDESDNIILGGQGSIAACSLFSASYACMQIIYYFLGIDLKMCRRGEYRIDQGDIVWIDLQNKKEKCKVCNV
ncbi:ThiF family adenylyltransferase [Campylobacter sp.]|uniref:ThiF family adenylyltransferase n=1 Tax=Campylobacter sp. TaxID=205 RepID=UPI0025BA2E57|nr:ThiF family adenylyltransferase [Campylobacter sp.]